MFQHGSNFHPLGERLFFPRTPAGVLIEGEEEYGTADIQMSYRFAPVRYLLKPRVTAKAQISTGGDLAAYGGAMHARIEANQHRLNERDHKLWKFAELNRRAAVRLRAQVERARTEVQA